MCDIKLNWGCRKETDLTSAILNAQYEFSASNGLSIKANQTNDVWGQFRNPASDWSTESTIKNRCLVDVLRLSRKYWQKAAWE